MRLLLLAELLLLKLLFELEPPLAPAAYLHSHQGYVSAGIMALGQGAA